MPFFWYLLQHLFLGFKQFEVQFELHIAFFIVFFCIVTLDGVFLFSL
ncbi:protein of unknown function [Tenacibaculum aestuariivivum]